MKFVILCKIFNIFSKNDVKVLTFLSGEMTVIILKNIQSGNCRGRTNKKTKYQVRCILAQ